MQEETRDQAGSHPGAGTDWPAPDGIVVVPTDGPWRPGDGDPRIRIGQAPDGTPVALAYSSPAAFTEVHGDHPWVAVRHAELLTALRPLGVQRFLIDGRPVSADA